MNLVKFWAILLSPLLLLGCGPEPIPTGTVKGTVMLGDEPYDGTMEIVLLNPDNGHGQTATINSDGTFAIEDPLPTGTYRAYFAPKADPNATSAVAVVMDKSVPEKYWNEVSTDLTVEIEEGENTTVLKAEK